MTPTNPATLLVAAGCALLAGCVADGSVTLPGATVPTRVEGAIDLGRVAGDMQLDFVVGLALRDRPRLGKLLSAGAFIDEGLAPEDFAQQFAPSRGDYSRVVAALRNQGLEVKRTVAGRTSISARGAAAVIERAFGTELHRYVDARGTFEAA